MLAATNRPAVVTSSRLARAVLLAAALVCGAAPRGAAQSTEAQAIAAAKAVSKAALAALKDQVKSARVVFLSQLDTFETQVEAGSMSAQLVQEFFDDLQELQAAVQAARSLAASEISAGQHVALEDLADGDDLDPLPVSFTSGTGSVADAWRTSLDGILKKFYKSLNKRLDKTEALVAKQSTFALLAWIGPPGNTPSTASSEAEGSLSVEELAIDSLVSSSDGEVDDDGVLWVGGPFRGSGTIDVDAIGHGDQPALDGVTVAGDDDRYAAKLAGLGGGIGETNYIVVAASTDDPANSRSMPFGIR